MLKSVWTEPAFLLQYAMTWADTVPDNCKARIANLHSLHPMHGILTLQGDVSAVWSAVLARQGFSLGSPFSGACTIQWRFSAVSARGTRNPCNLWRTPDDASFFLARNPRGQLLIRLKDSA